MTLNRVMFCIEDDHDVVAFLTTSLGAPPPEDRQVMIDDNCCTVLEGHSSGNR